MTDPIPYARPYWTAQEEAALVAVLRSGWWTAGATVDRFEKALGEAVGAPEVVCVSNGTGAIHALLHLLRRPRGRSLFVTPALNFVAGPAAAMQAGYDVALTDIDPATLNMSPCSLSAVLGRLAHRYQQIVVMPVHFAGLPADLDRLAGIAHRYEAEVVEDACQAFIARYSPGGAAVGTHPASLGATFSFHPTKPVATGEGGAIALADRDLASRLRRYRNHNIQRAGLVSPMAYDSDGQPNPWFYEVAEPGFNLRMSEFHAAVGLVQLARLPESLRYRRILAERYRRHLTGLCGLRFVPAADDERSALHLFPVSFDLDRIGLSKRQIFSHYRKRGVALQVHYTPLYELPVFASLEGNRGDTYPGVERISPGLVSLPLFMGLTEAEQELVISITLNLLGGN
ncbi:MAG TPA: DegT/DnrJ/EryC1/StrS family aminotransferase [Streptosporangiaceae bacterium]|jgi:dTDP-4-amino-4,6-dideoxygalactose transaminase|nr:DegT/DnrJ/EryC1/StrS family aminotransferase [Streptosporangiaceae bacterium]